MENLFWANKFLFSYRHGNRKLLLLFKSVNATLRPTVHFNQYYNFSSIQVADILYVSDK